MSEKPLIDSAEFTRALTVAVEMLDLPESAWHEVWFAVMKNCPGQHLIYAPSVTAREGSNAVGGWPIPRLQVGWQPIETAPKDVQVLLYNPRTYSQEIIIGYWGRDRWEAPDGDSIVVLDPTHWMPLPDAPQP